MNLLRSGVVTVVLLCPLIGFSGCRATQGAEGGSPDEQRSTIQSQRDSTLNELYAAKPETRAKVQNAAGYGFFSNVNVNLLLLSTENGYGVVRDNSTGKDTYMKMASGGVGVGAGVKDYRSIVIFNDANLMRQLIEEGWDFGGQADASAKTGEKGATAGESAAVGGGLEVYQFTEHGLALQATVQGAKYWPDEKLNK